LTVVELGKSADYHIDKLQAVRLTRRIARRAGT